MISLEKSPQNALATIDLISDGSVGLIEPRLDFLPERVKNIPGLLIPHELITPDHTELAVHGEAVMWGGVQSDEDIEMSTFFIVGSIEDEVAQHYIALINVINSGADSSVIRSFLDKARKEDDDIHQKIGSIILSSASLLEPGYCLADEQSQREFQQSTGYSIRGHRDRVRAEAGEVLFMSDVLLGTYQKILHEGWYTSERLQAEIPHDFDGVARRTTRIGAPYALNLGDRVVSACVTKEPRKPRKAHICAGCHFHIAAGALRATVGVDPEMRRFDHHHFHVGCI